MADGSKLRSTSGTHGANVDDRSVDMYILIVEELLGSEGQGIKLSKSRWPPRRQQSQDSGKCMR